MKLPLLDPWYAQGLSFTCTTCGNCCTGGPGFIWVNDEEIDRLAAHFNVTREVALKKYCRKVGGKISIKETRTPQGNYDCMFLTELPAEKIEGKVTQRRRVCGIYEVRPLQCRTWPFWDGNLASQAAWNKAAKRCPGMNTGTHYKADQIEALQNATEWPDRPPTSTPARTRTKQRGVGRNAK